MRLHCDPASPTTRRILVTAIEAGLGEALEMAGDDTAPSSGEPAIRQALGPQPVLEIEEGRKVFGTNAICAYLDGRHERPKMMPRQGAARLEVDQLEAWADDLLVAALALYRERQRPQAQRWSAEMHEHRRRLANVLNELEAVTATVLVGPVTLGHVAVGCAIDWLDTVLPAEDWRDGRPALADWHAQFRDRPSMRSTETAAQPH